MSKFSRKRRSSWPPSQTKSSLKSSSSSPNSKTPSPKSSPSMGSSNSTSSSKSTTPSLPKITSSDSTPKSSRPSSQSPPLPQLFCSICSFAPPDNYPVYHKHYSSKDIRRKLRVTGRDLYQCKQCQDLHMADPPLYQGGRHKVALSCSVLRGYHKIPGYVGDKVHVDWQIIPNGTIQDMQKAWYETYKDDPTPQDIVLCCGITNLLSGETRKKVMERLNKFQTAVQKLSSKHSMVSPSTLAVCTFTYVPALCWLPGNNRHLGISSHRLPSEGYQNKYDEMKKLNEDIQAFNRRHGMVGVPRCHSYGVRGDHHRLENWKEGADMFHHKVQLKDSIRLLIAKDIINYFLTRTNININNDWKHQNQVRPMQFKSRKKGKGKISAYKVPGL